MNILQKNELIEVEEFQSQDHPQFAITNNDNLNWAFRKISALKAQEKEIQQLAAAEKERIEQWEKDELGPVHNSISFFESHIQKYHAQLLAEDEKKNKTISTPYGKSKTRKSKESVVKQDEAKLLEHVIENEMDDYIKTDVKWYELKKSLKIVEISDEKAVVDENGQIVPGVSIKPESISYSVEV